MKGAISGAASLPLTEGVLSLLNAKLVYANCRRAGSSLAKAGPLFALNPESFEDVRCVNTVGKGFTGAQFWPPPIATV